METEKGTEIETKRERENWKKGSEKKWKQDAIHCIRNCFELHT